ncbi:diguanylate cyclase [Erysipelothrix larvae]|uniref:Diguanylate cyclase n=1 Tax=Erysipelothrix larvae TaxID=1514105 RepID=A0A0X8GZ86_9FIRM|nr:ABC transporter permease [Erysipelothrix larvae]AMC93147.1 diguanylate cyclase [Erysipelothrix larvae]
MFKYLIKRLISLIPVVIIISVLLFTFVQMMPGDPVAVMLGNSITDPEEYKAAYEAMRARMGLDASYFEQYIRWIVNSLKGQLGYSIAMNKPVTEVVARPLKNTIILNVTSLVLSFVISVFVGIRSAVKKGSFFDKFWQVTSIVGVSMPTLLIAVLLIYVFSLRLNLVPMSGMPSMIDDGSLRYYLELLPFMFLPLLTLTLGSFASTIRYIRNAMLDVLSSDYIRTARAKGVSGKVVIYSHAFRNALIPVVTIVAGSIPGIFGGAAITEQIFAWNGIGRVLIAGVNNLDYNLILAMNMFYAILSLVSNIIMDVGYALVDPRVKID